MSDCRTAGKKLNVSMTSTHSPAAVPTSVRVHFHGSDFDHELKLSEAFVRSLPSIDIGVARGSTVDHVISRAIDIHVESGATKWAGRHPEAVVLFGGMGSSQDDYYALGWHIYGVDDDGHLAVYDSVRDAVFVNVLRALEDEYFGLAPQDPLVVVALGAGWGGNGAFVADMVRWLGDVAPEIILGYLATKTLEHLPEAKQKKLRSLADKWARRKINSPFVLREWIQSKDSWQVSEVSKRLDLNDGAACELLLALGYEETGRGVLALKSSRDALARRDSWIFQETASFQDAMEGLVDPAPRTHLRHWLSRLRRGRDS